jgi:hypothetical protein
MFTDMLVRNQTGRMQMTEMKVVAIFGGPYVVGRTPDGEHWSMHEEGFDTVDEAWAFIDKQDHTDWRYAVVDIRDYGPAVSTSQIGHA